MRKYNKLLELFCCVAYFASYITRINLTAVVAEIVAAEGYLKSDLSVVVVMCSISYAAGQVICGLLGDKLNPVKFIFTGFIITICCNILIPIAGSVWIMAGIWLINGIAQAMMWPPMVRLLSRYMNGSEFVTASANVGIASGIATIFIYFYAPAVIHISNWKNVFYISATMTALIAVLWIIFMPKLEKRLTKNNEMMLTKPKKEKGDSFYTIFFKCGVFLVCLCAVMMGYIRDGIVTWIPSFISETFRTEATVSILASVIMPIFHIICTKITNIMLRKFSNELKFSALLYSFAGVLCLIWIPLLNSNIFLGLLLPAMIVGFIYGIVFLITSALIRRFAFTGRVSFIAGIINGFVYIGSSISTYVTARLAEIFGWRAAILTWGIVAFIGVVICLLTLRNKKIKEIYSIERKK